MATGKFDGIFFCHHFKKLQAPWLLQKLLNLHSRELVLNLFHLTPFRGLEIWRFENFQPFPLLKSDYGRFYMGDSYVVLQDEAGTAAIKTVELDAILGGRVVQHREIQSHESDKFLSYFKPCIVPLEGDINPTVATGFKKPEEMEFETRLYICKGKRVVHVKQIQFFRSLLIHDDVFILDTKEKIFQFNVANSNIQERAKSLEVIQYLKDTYHEMMENYKRKVTQKVLGDDDIVLEWTPDKLFKYESPFALVDKGFHSIVSQMLLNPIGIKDLNAHNLKLGVASHNLWLSCPYAVDSRNVFLSSARSLFQQSTQVHDAMQPKWTMPN
uniref:Gelsolin-like domain-containing protein n=1 Tax=Lactuca sativa TaxID=4236 RepID=A0A9R1W9A7_LACSA|nr:hypothetical protein LSAT_V11C200061600 [Lactuca sativa]